MRNSLITLLSSTVLASGVMAAECPTNFDNNMKQRISRLGSGKEYVKLDEGRRIERKNTATITNAPAGKSHGDSYQVGGKWVMACNINGKLVQIAPDNGNLYAPVPIAAPTPVTQPAPAPVAQPAPAPEPAPVVAPAPAAEPAVSEEQPAPASNIDSAKERYKKAYIAYHLAQKEYDKKWKPLEASKKNDQSLLAARLSVNNLKSELMVAEKKLKGLGGSPEEVIGNGETLLAGEARKNILANVMFNLTLSVENTKRMIVKCEDLIKAGVENDIAYVDVATFDALSKKIKMNREMLMLDECTSEDPDDLYSKSNLSAALADYTAAKTNLEGAEGKAYLENGLESAPTVKTYAEHFGMSTNEN